MEQIIGIGVAIFLSYLVLVAGVQEQTTTRQGENDSQRISNRHVRKTIQTKDGDVFDCIDINRQPAFDHPLLKDHEIQMKPSSYPTKSHLAFSSDAPATKSQLPTIACPAGTIPIMQNSKSAPVRPLIFDTMDDVDLGVEFAGIRTRDDIYGLQASIIIYETAVKGNADRSASWASVANGQGNSIEAIGAGSIVWPNFTGDSFARFHITWAVATQNYEACYDHLCPGFVQVSQVGLGARFKPISVYNGPQYQLDLLLYKDPKTKDWWLMGSNTTSIGYWPSSIFTDMRDKAIGSFAGGFVDGPTYKSNPSPMGSGHFANEGFGKAAFVRNLQIMNANNDLITPDTPKSVAGTTRKECYTVDNFSRGNGGMEVFFGGPGGCNN